MTSKVRGACNSHGHRNGGVRNCGVGVAFAVVYGHWMADFLRHPSQYIHRSVTDRWSALGIARSSDVSLGCS